MIALLLCGIIAGACAAPHFNEFPSKTPQRRPDFEDELSKFENFDSFMSGSDMTDFTTRFPTTWDALEGVEGTEYKINFPLYDFPVKDIVVKAHEGLVKIKVNDNNNNRIETTKILPDNVNLNGGNWILEPRELSSRRHVLKITFPLKDGVKDDRGGSRHGTTA
ncbi:hypothetical protein PYW07_011103 [Mythimna separata]|uniref:Uncharacterized protein n=1 Tax=Mythimna separata TaxID=271217 RepID=A0AAD7Y792_MYTSE|nr:hypothetical protein PYW07_011103 [Mythimna separata]